MMAMGFEHYSEEEPLGEDTFVGNDLLICFSYYRDEEEQAVCKWSVYEAKSRCYSEAQLLKRSEEYQSTLTMMGDLRGFLGDRVTKKVARKIESRTLTNVHNMTLSRLKRIARDLGYLDRNIYPLYAEQFDGFLAAAQTTLGQTQYAFLKETIRGLGDARFCFVSLYLGAGGQAIVNSDYQNALAQEVRAAMLEMEARAQGEQNFARIPL
jgi:hypothetical protein